ncbi:hypothetical protein NLU13_1023 [Sarocladium strictum]|uniref:Uncharacterized protein n=1 Tax=Sarocladium strictum TaxID=5046 RepID=A0AA39GQ61_SARSR|nr:hypothetical protein NLU13_1023 [Sarocladium strictum]
MNTAARIPAALTSTAAATTLRAATKPSSTISLAAASISRPVAPTNSVLLLPRNLHTTPSPLRAPEPSDNPGAMPDGLSERSAKGTTGGGEPLESSARNSPPKPKISNLSVPGTDGPDKLSEEQRREVEQHNKEFEEKHDRGTAAEDDKVDKSFWSSERGTD